MLDLAHDLRTELTTLATTASAEIALSVARFHDKALEAVARFNAETEARLQLLAQGKEAKTPTAPLEPPPGTALGIADSPDPLPTDPKSSDTN